MRLRRRRADVSYLAASDELARLTAFQISGDPGCPVFPGGSADCSVSWYRRTDDRPTGGRHPVPLSTLSDNSLRNGATYAGSVNLRDGRGPGQIRTERWYRTHGVGGRTSTIRLAVDRLEQLLKPMAEPAMDPAPDQSTLRCLVQLVLRRW